MAIQDADTLTLVGSAISAMAALGIASMALVDATKAFNGGISRVGFGHILKACKPFSAALKSGAGQTADGKVADGQATWEEILRAQWWNGRDKEAQKGLVRSLIRLGLTDGATGDIAAFCNVDKADFDALVAKLRKGGNPTDIETNMLGRVDAVVGHQIDAAYERADQQYRNTARVFAGLVAIALGLAAAAIITPAGDGELGTNLLYGLLAGLLAVPVAPIAKDLVSSLSSAVTAVKAVRGR